ncbi:MAG: hypothetical protein HEQ35_27180 [Gloeotrichia echinulata IR180]
MTEIKASKIMETINEIEAYFPVNKWKIDEIHIWPIIRILLMFHLFENSFLAKSKELRFFPNLGIAGNILQGIFKYSYAYLSDFRKNYKFNNLNNSTGGVCFLTYTTCRHLINQSWYDIFCEPYIYEFEKINLSSVLIELAPKHEYRHPRHKKSIYIQPLVDYFKINSRIFINTYKDYEFEKLQLFNDFTHYLESRKIIEIDTLKSILKNRLAVIRNLANYWKIFLTKLQPSLGLVVCYYGVEGMAFNLACRELNIISVDIQHGLQGELHAAYGCWNSLPPDGYELLPSFFWCWSDYEANVISKWNSQVSNWHKPIVGGNLWLNMWQDANNDIVRKYDRHVLEIKNLEPDAVHILYTLQPTEYFPLLDWILQVIKESPPSWFWWMRLHPGMMAERQNIHRLLESCQPANIEIDQATDLPLLALLRHTDVHITATSSTVIEAEFFGVPSVITHVMGTELFPHQISSKVAIPAFTHQELTEAIKTQVLKKNNLKKRQTGSSLLSKAALECLLSDVKFDESK